MKKFMLALLMLALPATAIAQNSSVRIIGRDSTGTDRPVLVTTDGRLQTSGTATARPTGTSADQVQGTNASGTTDIGNPVTVGGVDATNTTRKVLVAADGAVVTQDDDATPITSTTLTADGIFFNVDMTGYRGLSVLVQGQSGAGTFSVEGSNNGGTSWTSLQMMNVSNNSYTTSTQTGGLIFYIPKTTKLVRARLSQYTAGTWTTNAYMMQTNLDPGNVQVSGINNVGIQSGGLAIVGNLGNGAADGSNPIRIGGKVTPAGTVVSATTGTRVDASADTFGNMAVVLRNGGNVVQFNGNNIDGVGTQGAANILDANVYNRIFNGTQWDRIRDVNSAALTTGTGVPAAGILLYNSTANQYQRPRDATSAAGTTGTGLLGVGNLGWTGTSYVRFATDANGSQVVRDLDGQAVTVTPSSTNQGVLFSVPTTGYAGVSFQTGTAANGGTWNFQGSNDTTNGTDGNWATINAQQLNGNATSATQTANAAFFLPAATTWVRVVVSGTISSPIGGSAALRSIAPLPINIGSQTINNNKAQWNTEASNVALAANAAAVNGTIRDTGQAGGDYRFNYFSCLLVPNVASPGLVLRQLGSFDNSRFFVIQSVVVPAGATVAAPLRTSERIFARYNRCQWDNSGSSAAVNVDVASQYGE